MNKIAFLTLTILMLQRIAAHDAIEGVSVAVAPKKEVFFLGGPVVLYVTVTNHRKELVKITANCQPPECVDFVIATQDGSRLKPKTREEADAGMQGRVHKSFQPLEVGASAVYALVLNHQYSFKASGQYRVDLTIKVSAITRAIGQRPVKVGDGNYSATVNFEMKDASLVELNQELKLYHELLQNADLSKKYEGVDALCYLEMPFAAKYLRTVVDSENVREVDGFDFYASCSGIEALARIGTKEAMDLVHSKLFADKNSQVDAVLKVYASRKLLLPEADIERLKNSRNPWRLLNYLEVVGNSSHLNYAKQFVNSDNESIREIAKKCVEAVTRREQEKK